jgi:tetratricopeptide (TPR) repeat protein
MTTHVDERLAAAVRIIEAAEEVICLPEPGANKDAWKRPYLDAIALLDALIADDPQNDLARVYLAVAHHAVGERGAGGKAHRIAEELLSRVTPPEVRAGACCVMAYVSAHEAQGSADERTGEWYRRANATDPGHIKAAEMYADHLWGHEGDSEGSLAVLDAALLVHPEAAGLHQLAAYICQSSYFSNKDVELVRKGIRHALTLESLKPLGFGDCGELARCYARLSDWRSMMVWLKEADDREKRQEQDEHIRPVRRGIDDPVMWKLAETAITQYEADPANLDHAAYLAICLEYMQPVLASLCCDDIADMVDVKVPGTWQYLAERATLRINAALMSEGAFQYVPLENPWRHNVAPGPLGRRVKIIRDDGAGSSSNNGH